MSDQMLAEGPSVGRSRAGRRVHEGLDGVLIGMCTVRSRLIGLALLRLGLGVAAVLFYLSDYGNRQYFWGPNGYITPQIARAHLSRGLFSLYLVNDSQFWFELVFHAGLLVAVLFTIYGGRWITVAHAVFMWSIYNRNQDILEGGDNLARMLLIFMVLVVGNAYLSPGSKKRRCAMREQRTPTLAVLLHNLGMFLIVFQVAMVYFVSGYWKIAGTVWQQGVAMYYITRIPQFHMFGIVAEMMRNAYVGTAICYFTILIEIAYPFAISSTRMDAEGGDGRTGGTAPGHHGLHGPGSVRDHHDRRGQCRAARLRLPVDRAENGADHRPPASASKRSRRAGTSRAARRLDHRYPACPADLERTRRACRTSGEPPMKDRAAVNGSSAAKDGFPAAGSVILFDGECGFCRWTVSGLARWLHLPGQLLAWQVADLQQYGLRPEQTRASMWWVSTGRRAAGAAALAVWLEQGGPVVRLIGLLLNGPLMRAPAQLVYRWIARHRRHIPGPWALTCRL